MHADSDVNHAAAALQPAEHVCTWQCSTAEGYWSPAVGYRRLAGCTPWSLPSVQNVSNMLCTAAAAAEVSHLYLSNTLQAAAVQPAARGTWAMQPAAHWLDLALQLQQRQMQSTSGAVISCSTTENDVLLFTPATQSAARLPAAVSGLIKPDQTGENQSLHAQQPGAPNLSLVQPNGLRLLTVPYSL